MPEGVGVRVGAPHVGCCTRQDNIVFRVPSSAIEPIKRRLKRVTLLVHRLHLNLVPKAAPFLALPETLNPRNVQIARLSGFLSPLSRHCYEMRNPSSSALPAMHSPRSSLSIRGSPGIGLGVLCFFVALVPSFLGYVCASSALRGKAVFCPRTLVETRNGLARTASVTILLRNQAT
jgi:hypothetical protein